MHSYADRRWSNTSGDSTTPLSQAPNGSQEEGQELIQEEQKKNKDKRHGNGLTRRQILLRQLGMFLTMMIINIGIPMAIFYVFRIFTNDIVALIVSGVPPLLRVIYVMIRQRRVDVGSSIFVLAFVISAALTAISANARVAVLRDSLSTVVIAVLFLLTLIPIRTRWLKVYPFTHIVNSEMLNEAGPITWINEHGQEESMSRAEWTWDHIKKYRIFNYILSFSWGIALILNFVAIVIMLEMDATIGQIVLWGNIILIIIFVILFPTTAYVLVKLQKRINQAEDDWRAEHDYTDTFNNNDTASSDHSSRRNSDSTNYHHQQQPHQIV